MTALDLAMITPVTAAVSAPSRNGARSLLLDPGLDLTLRPMRYPDFFQRFKDAIANTWSVEEVDLHNDLADLNKLSPAERHLIQRLVAFFATGDTIVANNLVLNLYTHVNAPEARLYLSRQLFGERPCTSSSTSTCSTPTCPTRPSGSRRSPPRSSTFRRSRGRRSSASAGSTPSAACGGWRAGRIGGRSC